MSFSGNLPLNELEKHLLDPDSGCYVENLLDLVTSLVNDCNYPSASTSRTVQAFLNRYRKVAELIENQRTKFVDFELIKVIGQGGFGRVELVRHKRTRRVYAMKMMSKQHLLDQCQSGYWEERDIMVKAPSPWLVACHHAFLDRDNVYLCMEYMPGGDLLGLLEKHDTLIETQARFYLAEMVMALESLHSLRFIHRDLKPDNLLLDARGHVKLADFGSCVQLGEDGYHFCSSPIGTPDYISPEMLNCQSKAGNVGPECDWWAVGVIAFEMMFGEPAFFGQSLLETYGRILSHEKSFAIPKDADPISTDCENFIRALLKPAATRLGSLASVLAANPNLSNRQQAIALTAEQVKSHPFFSDVLWHQLRSQDAPFQPVVNSEIDTSNINFNESELQSSGAGSSGSINLPHVRGAFAARKPPAPAYFTGSNLSFAGYTFNRDHVYLTGSLRSAEGTLCNTATTPNQNQVALSEASQKADSLKTELDEMRGALQTLEKQAAVDRVTLKDAQRRLNESTTELSKTRSSASELEKTSADLQSRCASLQTERDRLHSEVNAFKTQLNTLTESFEAERSKVSSLDEMKSNLTAEVEQLRLRLQETQIQLNEHMKLQEQVQSSGDSSKPSLQSERLASLEQQVSSLQAENRAARQKSTVLMIEANNLNRNHTKQVNILNDQLLEAQRFSLHYQSECDQLRGRLEAAQSLEHRFQEELASVRAELDKAVSDRRTIEDRLVYTESLLAATQVELRSVQDITKTEQEQATALVTRLTQSVEQRLVELNAVSAQLDEMRTRCADAEQDSSRLTEQVSKLQKERELQQRNMKAIVDKLVNEVQGRMTPDAMRKRAKEHDTVACQKLAKDYKFLQSEMVKIKADMQNSIDQYKRDLADSNNLLATLTDECRNKDHELSEMRALIHHLYMRLDQTAQTSQSTPNKPEVLSPTLSAEGTADSIPTQPDSQPLMSPVPSIQTTLPELPTTALEQIVDLDGKGKGRKKFIWSPKYAVLKPFILIFYASRADKEMGSNPLDEIPLSRVLHVRKATSADLIHAQPGDIPRTLQFFFQLDDGISSPLSEGADVDLNSTLASVRSVAGSSSSSAVTNGPGDSRIRWLDHTFHPMRFRMPVMCEVCRRHCSDLRSPPLALECDKCGMRIHLNHVEQHEKFKPCYQATKVRYIRLPSAKEQSVWLEHMSTLIRGLRELQQNPERLLESGFAGVAGGVAHIGTGAFVHSISRSTRSGSSGSAKLNNYRTENKRSSLHVNPHRISGSPKSSSRSTSPNSPSCGK